MKTSYELNVMLLCRISMEKIPVVKTVIHIDLLARLYLPRAFDKYLLFLIHCQTGICLET